MPLILGKRQCQGVGPRAHVTSCYIYGAVPAAYWQPIRSRSQMRRGRCHREQQEDVLVTAETIRSLGRAQWVLARDECSLESKEHLQRTEKVHNETDIHTKCGVLDFLELHFMNKDDLQRMNLIPYSVGHLSALVSIKSQHRRSQCKELANNICSLTCTQRHYNTQRHK